METKVCFEKNDNTLVYDMFNGSQNGSWCGLAIAGILLAFVKVKRNLRVRLGAFVRVCESSIRALPSAG
jgi:hypothetical protein